jgi:hypothetical protein
MMTELETLPQGGLLSDVETAKGLTLNPKTHSIALNGAFSVTLAMIFLYC